MVALSLQSGEKIWESRVSTTVASAPIVAGGRVIFTTLNNRTYALNAKSGELLWNHSSVPVSLVIKGAATPVVNKQIVYIGYSTGELFALNLNNGKPLWEKNLSRLSGRSELDRIHDFDAEVVVGPESLRNPVVAIYVVNYQGSVLAMRSNSGAKIWEHKSSAIRRPLLWG